MGSVGVRLMLRLVSRGFGLCACFRDFNVRSICRGMG